VAFTDKQIRNGDGQGGGDGQNTAVPGPDATSDISSAKAQAEAAAAAQMHEGHALTGELAGHTVSFTSGVGSG
jgi:hypothetical protein